MAIRPQCTPLTRAELHDIANHIMQVSLTREGSVIATDFNRIMAEREFLLGLLQALVEHTPENCQRCLSEDQPPVCPWNDARTFLAEFRRAA